MEDFNLLPGDEDCERSQGRGGKERRAAASGGGLPGKADGRRAAPWEKVSEPFRSSRRGECFQDRPMSSAGSMVG